MGADSRISWTDHTFNPWWGCTKVSPECAHCYADAFAQRVGHQVWGAQASRRFFGDAHWREPVKWDAEAAASGTRPRVFCASMADVLEDRDDLVAPRERLLDLIERTPHLTWLLLTKRPEHAERMLARWYHPARWPAHVWFGTTIGHQDSMDRLGYLRMVPAPVVFVSAGPVLGELSFVDATEAGPLNLLAAFDGDELDGTHSRKIDWLIVEGESNQPGKPARPCELNVMERLAAQADAAGTAFFCKQLGSNPHRNGRAARELVRRSGDRNLTNLARFPQALQRRELPTPLTPAQVAEVFHVVA
jgi:protein gp37